MYLVAWAVPVVKGGITLPEGLPGWQAFRVAASPVWSYEDVRYDSSYGAVLATASAGTNVLMISLAWLASLVSPRLHRIGAGAALAAFIVNAHWFVLMNDRADLRLGYFLWWFSFLVIGYSLFRLSKGYPTGLVGHPAA
jgi:hypothetical protein